MPRGGRRAGAGRRKGTPDPHTRSRAVLDELYRAFMFNSHSALWQAQLERALGVFVLLAKTETGYERVTNPDAIARIVAVPQDRGTRYWLIETRPPDAALVKEINNRLMGVPTQPHEVSGAVGLTDILAGTGGAR